MTRRAKSAIIFGAVGAAAVGIGIIIALVYNQTVGEMLQRLTGKMTRIAVVIALTQRQNLDIYHAIRQYWLSARKEHIMPIPSLEKHHFHLNGNLAMVLP